jgi:hypothetical protein
MALAVLLRVDDMALDRHRCSSPRCRRHFAVVYRCSSLDVPIRLALACPHCGRQHELTVLTGAVRDSDGAYVLPLDGDLSGFAA